MIPPTSIPVTTTNEIMLMSSATKNPTLAAAATANSLASVLPTALRGRTRPEARSVGVTMGPHPPPPAGVDTEQASAVDSAGTTRPRPMLRAW